MIGEWIKWKPVEGLNQVYYLDVIIGDMDKFSIHMFSENRGKKIEIMFGNSVDSHRITNESFRWREMHEISEKYGKDFRVGCPFFQVTNSAYLKWLSEQSYGIADSLELMHFVFFTMDWVIDVIATEKPTIELIEVD